MVWQDFMFACSVYELTPEFEANIRQEMIENVKRIRHHASLALWCGNNEMEMFVASGTWVTSGGSFDEPNDDNRGDVHYWEVWHFPQYGWIR